PASTNLSLTTTQSQSFSLSLLQPVTHNLNVQWTTNGVAVPGGTNSSFTVSPATLPNGTNYVRAVVHDGTALVQNDPTNLLGQTLTWSVNVAIPQLHLDSPQWLASGKFVARISGYAPQSFVVQGSTNLLTWTSLSTNSLAGGQFWYTNTPAAGSA